MDVFNKIDTKRLKGVAILLMLFYHLYAFPSRINYEYISCTSFIDMNIELLIAPFGKMCIYIFLFLSGYGICKKFDNRKVTFRAVFNQLRGLYINYWSVFIIFVSIGFLFFNWKFDIVNFILNFIGISCSFNGEWWFLRLYLYLILSFPLLKKFFPNSCFNFIFLFFDFFILGYIINWVFNFLSVEKTVFYSEIILFLTHQIYFYTGYFFSKFDIFQKINKNKIFNSMSFIFFILVLIIFRILIKTNILDFVIVPILIVGYFIVVKK